jgi:adenine-specific DNA methylase
MKLLELFSGTSSVGKVAKQLGYDIVSLDLKKADINIDILQ